MITYEKRLLASFITIALLSTIPACTTTESGGGASENESTTPNNTSQAENSSSDEPVTIEIAFSAANLSFNETDFVKEKIAEDLGIELIMSNFATSDELKTNANLRLVGETAPDMFSVTKTDLNDLIDQDFILPLDDYLADNPALTEWMGEAALNGQVDGVQYTTAKSHRVHIYKAVTGLGNIGLMLRTYLCQLLLKN